MVRAQDIDYAAAAVKKAIVKKFSDVELQDLQVTAGEQTIYVELEERNPLERLVEDTIEQLDTNLGRFFFLPRLPWGSFLLSCLLFCASSRLFSGLGCICLFS